MKKQNQEEKQKRTKKQVCAAVPIRVQLIVGFVIPILFVIVIGWVSYSKASDGMTKNYESSARNALEMTMTSFDEAMQNVATNALELSQDSMVNSYALGGFQSDTGKRTQAASSIRKNLTVKETASHMINGIHVIPIDEHEVITTKTLSAASLMSFIDGMAQSDDRDLLTDDYIHWGSAHPYIDQQMKINQEDYILYCSRTFKSGGQEGVVVIDIGRAELLQLLQKLDFGEGAGISFVTAQGTELSCEDGMNLSNTDAFLTGLESGEEMVSEYVTNNNKDYYFMMCKSSVTGGSIAVMVPKSVITAGSKDIEHMTIAIVILSCLAAAVLGALIIHSITGNISRSISRLEHVAQGELLTGHSEIQGNLSGGEFGKLHRALDSTVFRIRELVLAVKQMIELVSASSDKVGQSSRAVGVLVSHVGGKVEEIRSNIEQENVGITRCNDQIDELSIQIELVSKSVMENIDQIENSKQMI